MQSTSPSQLRDLHWHTAVAYLILRLFQLVMTERGRQPSVTDLQATLANLQATERSLRQEITSIENSIRDSRAYYKTIDKLRGETLSVAQEYITCDLIAKDERRSTKTRSNNARRRDAIAAMEDVDATILTLLGNRKGWNPPHTRESVAFQQLTRRAKEAELTRTAQAISNCQQCIENARRACDHENCATTADAHVVCWAGRSRSRSRSRPGAPTRQLSLPQPPLAVPPYAQPQPAQPSQPRRQSSGHNQNPGGYNPNAFYGQYYPQR